jgi:hypothetical protein
VKIVSFFYKLFGQPREKNMKEDSKAEKPNESEKKKPYEETTEIESLEASVSVEKVVSLDDESLEAEKPSGSSDEPVPEVDSEETESEESDAEDLKNEESDEVLEEKQNTDEAEPGKTAEDEATKEAPVKPKPKPKWLELEPKDRTDPVPHLLKKYSQRDESWAFVAASVRGKLHAHRAMWREDSFAFDWVGPWSIMVVADGAGSAGLSRIGSSKACEHSVSSLKTMLDGFEFEQINEKQPTVADLKRLKAFLVLAVSDARDALLREAHARECELKDLSTTLLLVVHSKWREHHFISSIQVGDGAMAIYRGEKDGCQIIGEADHGEFSSQTVFLTSDLRQKPFAHRVPPPLLLPNLECIALMTDGVSDDFFPESERLNELFADNPVQGLKTPDGDEVRGAYPAVLASEHPADGLADWMNYQLKGSSDDRSLLMFYRKP